LCPISRHFSMSLVLLYGKSFELKTSIVLSWSMQITVMYFRRFVNIKVQVLS
jgi:hypothetical protein